MGIKNLNTLLHKKCPQVFKTCSLSLLKGGKVAIDAHNWMYVALAVASKDVIKKTNVLIKEPDETEILQKWLKAAMDFNCRWLAAGILPVWVFDGQHLLEKVKTQEDRKSNKERVLSKIKELRATVDVLDPLTHGKDILIKLQDLMCQVTILPKNNQGILSSVLKAAGLPVMMAKHDGEQLCSMLCREGLVNGVFSTDTDNLVYGCPLLLSKFSGCDTDEKGDRTFFCDAVQYKEVLSELNLSEAEFTDFCISCGCDFNTNMPNYAAVKSLKLIKDYGSIDNYPKHLKIACLNHIKCRELFTPIASKELIKEGVINIDKESLKEGRALLELYGVDYYLKNITIYYSTYEELCKKKQNIFIIEDESDDNKKSNEKSSKESTTKNLQSNILSQLDTSLNSILAPTVIVGTKVSFIIE